MATPSLSELLEQLSRPDEATHQAAAQRLTERGDLVVPALVALARDSKTAPQTRHRAFMVLGRIGTAQAVKQLLILLEKADPNTAHHIEEAMSGITNPASADVLLGALNAADETTRQLAAGALGRIRDQRAIPALVERLDDNSVWVRCNAVWALGQVGSVAAVPALVRALEDDTRQVRMLAITALGENHPNDEATATRLAAMLDDPDLEVRQEASGALVQVGSMAGEAVIPLLAHQDVSVRELAVLVMRWIGDQRAVPALTRCLKDDSAYVRYQAARALGRLRDRQAIAPLRQLLQDPDQRIRQTAELSLRKLDAGATE